MVILGLLPLAAFAQFAGVATERPFYLPTTFALILGFALGIAVCTLVGRALGLLSTGDIGTYTARHQHEVSATAAARRRGAPPRHSRIRSTAAAPFARFG
jgi:hypothetical protein